MASLLTITLANVAMALLLALLAAAVSRWGKRPALAHGLWALVLVKLITPPLWNVKVDWSVGALERVETRAEVAEKQTMDVPLGMMPTPTPAAVPEWLAQEPEVVTAITVPETFDVTPATPMNAVVAESSPPIDWMGLLPAALLSVWILGSVIVLMAIAVRTVKFARILKYARFADRIVQSRARALAWKMQIEKPPGVWFVSGAVCPMLWAGIGKARLLVPRELWERLDAKKQSSLLAHELSHLKRRDHWVRLLEVLATVAFWWCPLMWWARAGLREAEEQCCDAWVIWALPGQGRDYAGALLETVEFVSEKGRESGLNPPPPMLASGMGQFHQLARRLTMIKSERIPRKLSWIGKTLVGAVALAWVPLAPIMAQDTTPGGAPAPVVAQEAPAETPVQTTVEVRVEETLPSALIAPPVVELPSAESVLAADAAGGALAQNDPEAKLIEKIKTAKGKAAHDPAAMPADPNADPKLAAEVDMLRAEIKKLEAHLAAAKARLAATEARWPNRVVKATVDQNGNRRIVEIDAATGKIIAEHNHGKTSEPRPGASARSATPPTASNATAPAKPMPGAGMPPGTTSHPAGAYRKILDSNRVMSREQRLDQIESNLRAMLDEVKAMKAESRRDEGSETPKPAQRR